MSIGARILKNTTFLALGDKIGYLMQFVFFLYFAQKFGVIPVGEYSFAFFFTYAFAMLADSGVSVYLVREVARNVSGDRQLFFNCLAIRVTSLIIVFFLASIVLVLFFSDISSQKLRLIQYWGLYWIFFQLADVFLAELNGHEKMGRVALLGIWQKLLSTIAGLFLIYIGLSYDTVLIVFPISSFIYLCSCIMVSRYTLGPINGKFKKLSYYRNFFVELTPFFFSVVLVEILNCQDILILGSIQNDQAVGIYSSAIKIVTFILGISAFTQIAIFPVLSRLFTESKEKLISISEQILRYLILLSLPLSFGMVLTADKIINLLYSESFQEAGVVLKIAGWAIVAGFVQIIFSALLTAINRQKEKVIFIGITFLLTTLLNMILISYFSYVGAAAVKIITVLMSFVFFAYLVKRYMVMLSIIKFSLKPILACLIMTIFIHFFYHLNLPILISASGLVYFASLVVLRTFTVEDISFIMNMFPRRHVNQ